MQREFAAPSAIYDFLPLQIFTVEPGVSETQTSPSLQVASGTPHLLPASSRVSAIALCSASRLQKALQRRWRSRTGEER